MSLTLTRKSCLVLSRSAMFVVSFSCSRQNRCKSPRCGNWSYQYQVNSSGFATSVGSSLPSVSDRMGRYDSEGFRGNPLWGVRKVSEHVQPPLNGHKYVFAGKTYSRSAGYTGKFELEVSCVSTCEVFIVARGRPRSALEIKPSSTRASPSTR